MHDRFAEKLLSDGAEAIGAFDHDGALAGLGMVRYEIRPQVAQLALLYVSNARRRQGVATQLARKIDQAARLSGATRIYVSATPSRSAVQFYQSQGFAPTGDPIPELLALEPEDIHMVKCL